MSRISLCDTRTGASTHSLVGHKKGCDTLKWYPQNEFYLVSGGIDHSIKMWDIRKSGCVRSFDRNLNKICSQSRYSHIIRETTSTYAHLASLVSLQFTKSGLHLVSLSSDMEIILWDMADYSNCLVKYHTHTYKKCVTNEIAVSPDENVITVGLGARKIGLYDLLSGTLISCLTENYGGIRDLKFHPIYEVSLMVDFRIFAS